MEGFGFPIFLVFIVVVILLIGALALKNSMPAEKANKAVGAAYACLLLADIALIIVSLSIGGWAGMGYGIIGICVLIGTIIAGFLYTIIYYFSGRKDLRK